jgi:hypothetical protein
MTYDIMIDIINITNGHCEGIDLGAYRQGLAAKLLANGWDKNKHTVHDFVEMLGEHK